MASDKHAKYGLDMNRLVTNTQGLLVGSVETSSAAIVQSMQYMFEHPSVLQMAKAAAAGGDDEKLSRIVWESLRFDPVNPWVVRVTTREVKLKEGPNHTETTIPAGSVVFLATRSAMHDNHPNSPFVNPEQFSLERPQDKLTHLGWSYHRCLGDQVALVMVPEVIKQLLLLEDISLADDGEKIDFEKGPFPEKWSLKYKIPKRETLVSRSAKAMDTAEGFSQLLNEIGKLLRGSPKKAETEKAMKAALDPLANREDHEKAIEDLPALIETAEHKLTVEERAQLCLNKNPKSKEVFPNPVERNYYCHVNITFRACYFIQRLVVKHTSRPSYEYCVYNRKFMTAAEEKDFAAHMFRHPQFDFLAESLTGLEDVK